jgi:hypothetical protein
LAVKNATIICCWRASIRVAQEAEYEKSRPFQICLVGVGDFESVADAAGDGSALWSTRSISGLPSRMLVIRCWLRHALSAFRAALGDAALATWAQAALVGFGFYFTVQQIRSADHNNAVNLAAQFVTKYIDLDIYRQVGQYSIAQYDAVQKAKTQIPDYAASSDPGFKKLLEVAKPSIVEALREKDKDNTTDNILKIEQFFELVSRCARQSACDEQTIASSMADTMLVFFNAVCPYTEKLGNQWKQMYFAETLSFLYFNREIKDPNRYLCTGFLQNLDPKKKSTKGD